MLTLNLNKRKIPTIVKNKDFLLQQDAIYENFRKAKEEVRKIGLIPNIKPLCGYLVALRHPYEVVKIVDEFSQRVARVVPSIVYNKDSIHTTISDYGVSPIYDPHKSILEGLVDSVYSAVKCFNAPSIVYNEWLYNTNSVIIAGNPSSSFFELSKKIKKTAERHNIELRFPSMAHITVSRFIERKNINELSDFLSLMEETEEIGVSNPNFIDVAYFSLNEKNGFEIDTYCKIELKTKN